MFSVFFLFFLAQPRPLALALCTAETQRTTPHRDAHTQTHHTGDAFLSFGCTECGGRKIPSFLFWTETNMRHFIYCDLNNMASSSGESYLSSRASGAREKPRNNDVVTSSPTSDTAPAPSLEQVRRHEAGELVFKKRVGRSLCHCGSLSAECSRRWGAKVGGHCGQRSARRAPSPGPPTPTCCQLESDQDPSVPSSDGSNVS